MDEVEIVVAHAARVTLRAGELFIKVDPERRRVEREIAAMALAPVPTAEVRWYRPPVLALGRVPGQALGRLGEPSPASPRAWMAAGAAIRRLHDAPLPPWPGRSPTDIEAELGAECDWLLSHDVLPPAVIVRNRELAAAVLRRWTPRFIHGDLQIAHVFLDADEVSGILDWSEAGPGDPCYDLATLTLGQEDRLDYLLAGYGTEVDRDVIRGWWSLRCLVVIRWLIEHGYDPAAPGCEIAVLKARM